MFVCCRHVTVKHIFVLHHRMLVLSHLRKIYMTHVFNNDDESNSSRGSILDDNINRMANPCRATPLHCLSQAPLEAHLMLPVPIKLIMLQFNQK